MALVRILVFLLLAGFASAQVEFQTPLAPLQQLQLAPTAFAQAADGGQWVYVPTRTDGVLLKLNKFGEITHKRRTHKLTNVRFSPDSTGVFLSYQDGTAVFGCYLARFDLALNKLFGDTHPRDCAFQRFRGDLIRRYDDAFERISLNGANSFILTPLSDLRPPYSYLQPAQGGLSRLLTLGNPGLELIQLDQRDQELSRTRVPYSDGEGIGFGTANGVPLLFFQQPTQFGVARILSSGAREMLAQFPGPAIHNIQYRPYPDAAVSEAGHLFFSFGLFHSQQPEAVANSIVVVHPDTLEIRRIDLPPQWYWGGKAWTENGPESILIYAEREEANGEGVGAVFRLSFDNGRAEQLLNLATPSSQAMLSRGPDGFFWLGVRDKTVIFDDTGQIQGEVRIPIDDYGRLHVVSDERTGQSYIARKFEDSGLLALESYVEGRLVWRRILDSVPPSVFTKIMAAHQTICASFQTDNPSHTRLMCFRQTDGNLLGELPKQIAGAIDGWLIAPDGSFMGSYNQNALSYVVRWDFQSEPRTKQVSYSINEIARFGADGRLWLIGPNPSNKLLVVDAQDNVASTSLPGYVFSMELINQDDAVLAYQKNSTLHFERRSWQGQLRWTCSGAAEDFPLLARNLALSNGNLFVVRSHNDTSLEGYFEPALTVTKIERIDLQTGEVNWSTLYRSRRTPKLHVLNEQMLQLVTYQKRGLYVEAMSTHNGSLLGGVLNDFGGYGSSVEDFKVLPNGKTLVRAKANGLDGLYLLKSASGIPSNIRIDQQALSGIWYNPSHNGEGLMVQYFPAQRLLFAPWFFETFVKSTSSTESRMRWLTLSGEVPSGAKEAHLQIYANEGGRFAQSPVTQGRVVGQATMQALSCSEIIVKYEFERDLPDFEPPSYIGMMQLQRLAGDFANCERADGTTQMATQFRPALAGFDTQQSGAWFNPDTSGQGLMLTVQPPTTDGSASGNGFFFGAWFTHDALPDPYALPNYGSTQDWLTIGGETKASTAGTISFSIYRTIGGEFEEHGTSNHSVIGTGSLQMLSCDRAVLSYSFDDGFHAGQFRGLSGTQNLQKIVSCAQSF